MERFHTPRRKMYQFLPHFCRICTNFFPHPNSSRRNWLIHLSPRYFPSPWDTFDLFRFWWGRRRGQSAVSIAEGWKSHLKSKFCMPFTTRWLSPCRTMKIGTFTPWAGGGMSCVQSARGLIPTVFSPQGLSRFSKMHVAGHTAAHLQPSAGQDFLAQGTTEPKNLSIQERDENQRAHFLNHNLFELKTH